MFPDNKMGQLSTVTYWINVLGNAIYSPWLLLRVLASLNKAEIGMPEAILVDPFRYLKIHKFKLNFTLQVSLG